MQIRKMRPEDYDRVYALWLSCPGMGLNHPDDSREGIEKYLARNPETCFVAEGESGIVGAILSGHDGRRGTIRHAAVAPGHRGRGIGRQLVEAALGAMQAQGIRKVNLVVFANNEEGNAFWERMGFARRPDLTYRNRALTDVIRIDT